MAPRVPRWLLVTGVSCLLACAPTSAFAQEARTPRGYAGSVSGARVSLADHSHLVISLDAAGELPGLMTLDIDRAAQGDAKGTWVLKVWYTQDLNADGTVATEPIEHDEAEQNDPAHHREYIRFVNEGAVNGDVSAVTFRYDADGAVSGVESVQLLVTGGSLNFDGATGGGEIAAAPTEPHDLLLSLNF